MTTTNDTQLESCVRMCVFRLEVVCFVWPRSLDRGSKFLSKENMNLISESVNAGIQFAYTRAPDERNFRGVINLEVSGIQDITLQNLYPSPAKG